MGDVKQYLIQQLALPSTINYIAENYGMFPVKVCDKVCELLGEEILEVVCKKVAGSYEVWL